MEILLVQPYEDFIYKYQELYDEVKAIIQEQSVDLVVFPEAFIELEDMEEAWSIIEYIGEFLDRPVLLGFSMPDGVQEAYYYNHSPKDGETEEKLYIKHSTANKTLFDLDLNSEIEEQIYYPIILKGKRIQVYICHDMFFPLLTERLEQEGLDILINLTGGNVKMSKWCNLLKGRSIELNTFVFCTMANREDMKQPSDRIGYYQGKKMSTRYEAGNGVKEHAFSIFSIVENQQFLEEPAPYYSDKVYDHFTIGTNKQADCVIDMTARTIESSLPTGQHSEHSLQVMKEKENIQVHVANFENLYDRTYLYKQPRYAGTHQVIVYISEEDIDRETVIALLKLRSIESRVAAIVVAPNLLIGTKTNRYKDVQLFSSTNNQIGLDLQHMYGIDSIYQKSENSTLGIPLKHKKKYEELVHL